MTTDLQALADPLSIATFTMRLPLWKPMSHIWKTTGSRIFGESHFRGPGANDYPGGAPTSARQALDPQMVPRGPIWN